MREIGVDDHVRRHTRHGDEYGTVVIGRTPARDKAGPSRLPDRIEGRCKSVFELAGPQAGSGLGSGLGKLIMQQLIESLGSGVPPLLAKGRTLDRTLEHRRPAPHSGSGTSRTPSPGGLLETGGYRNRLPPRMRRA